jgi:hypothetical protein
MVGVTDEGHTVLFPESRYSSLGGPVGEVWTGAMIDVSEQEPNAFDVLGWDDGWDATPIRRAKMVDLARGLVSSR